MLITFDSAGHGLPINGLSAAYLSWKMFAKAWRMPIEVFYLMNKHLGMVPSTLENIFALVLIWINLMLRNCIPVVPNLFWCNPPFLHFGTFHSSLLHKFSRVTERIKISFLQ